MNPATQLGIILETVRSSEEPTVSAAWAKYLATEYDSDAFAYAHAEVLLLLLDALRYAFALPTTSRERYLKYSKSWWAACLFPGGPWEASAPSNLISTSELAWSLFGDIARPKQPTYPPQPAASISPRAG